MGIDDDAVLNRDVDAVQTEVRSHDQALAVESDKPQGAAGPIRDLTCILDGLLPASRSPSGVTLGVLATAQCSSSTRTVHAASLNTSAATASRRYTAG